jgi:allantoinase
LMQTTFPHIDFRREVTVGHLLADFNTANLGGKVNPPLRSPDDVEALWDHLLAGDLSWVTSDHACCRDETKFGEPRDDVFVAKSGFGGTEYLLPGMVSEGRKRGLTYNRIAELVSRNPAERFGMSNKGDLAVGNDADFCLLDDSVDYEVHASDSFSTQEYTPFEGFRMTAKVTDTFLRGEPILSDGAITGRPRGQYVRRSGASS